MTFRLSVPIRFPSDQEDLFFPFWVLELIFRHFIFITKVPQIGIPENVFWNPFWEDVPN